MSRPARADVVVGGTAGKLPTRVVREAVTRVLDGERRDASFVVTFLGPRRMRNLNAEYKDHDWATDVISFSLPMPDGSLTGDLYICPAVAAREAHSRGIRVREELVRLVVHGTLHVLGYDHPEGEGRTASPMWQKQEHYVRALT
ncbi:MAG: rRNA maturation RNase YbeY [Gemmatimonadales bacterium]